jgi:hypothetical protein
MLTVGKRVDGKCDSFPDSELQFPISRESQLSGNHAIAGKLREQWQPGEIVDTAA